MVEQENSSVSDEDTKFANKQKLYAIADRWRESRMASAELVD